jgi:hypothetical protein
METRLHKIQRPTGRICVDNIAGYHVYQGVAYLATVLAAWGTLVTGVHGCK